MSRQSDLLWASLIKQLYDTVEESLGKEAVRHHRASIALSSERSEDSPETKRFKRKSAMQTRRVDAALSIAGGLAVAIGLYFAIEQLLGVILCPASSDADEALLAFCNCTAASEQLVTTASDSEAAEEALAGDCLLAFLAEAPRLIMHVGGASSESLADHSKLRVDIIVTFVLL